VLTFHAKDTHGLPINDIKKDEIRLWDNGVAPRRVVAFDSLLDRPIRIGFLLDTSESMQYSLPGNKVIAGRYAEQVTLAPNLGRVSPVKSSLLVRFLTRVK
jgi:hypothetical protein